LTEVINIRFRNTGKVYYFAPNGVTAAPGDFVIVETAKGIEYGECCAGNHMVDESSIVSPLRPVIRVATEEDKQLADSNREKEAKAFTVCQEKIESHKLDMKLVDVEYSFEGNKILFFFTSDGRVDFRELVKDLVSIFRARIELRQIGVRDGAKMLGGLGICGREFCCSSFLDDFHPVSIKMAKTQSLSLNPTKISGTCGRLMCCLKYEQAAYEDLVKSAPKVTASVLTPYGQGTVIDLNLLRQMVKVRVDEGDNMGMHDVPFSDIGKSVSSVPKPEAPAPIISPRPQMQAEPFSNRQEERRPAPIPRQEQPANQQRQQNLQRPVSQQRPPQQQQKPQQPQPQLQKPPQPQPQPQTQRPLQQPKPISQLSSKPAEESAEAQLQKKNNPKHRFHKNNKPGIVNKSPTPSEGDGERPASTKAAPFRKKRRKPKPPAAPN
jgi:cell fate regulator YaaT (PSP1 superfamily)